MRSATAFGIGCALAAARVLAGCSVDDGASDGEGGADSSAAVDGSSPASDADTASDAAATGDAAGTVRTDASSGAPDAAPDATVDAAPDAAAADAGTDAHADAGTDSGTPPGNCAVAGYTQLTQSTVAYGVVGTSPNRPDVDLEEWNNIWGHFSSSDALVTWPGINGSGPTFLDFHRTSFIAAHFRTGTDTSLVGMFTLPYAGLGSQDWSISTACGDFAGAGVPGCVATSIVTPGNTILSWTFAANNASKCVLRPSTDYYVNIRYDDPGAASPSCAAGVQVCPLGTLQQIN